MEANTCTAHIFAMTTKLFSHWLARTIDVYCQNYTHRSVAPSTGYFLQQMWHKLGGRGWGAVHNPCWMQTSTTRWLHGCFSSFNNRSPCQNKKLGCFVHRMFQIYHVAFCWRGKLPGKPVTPLTRDLHSTTNVMSQVYLIGCYLVCFFSNLIDPERWNIKRAHLRTLFTHFKTNPKTISIYRVLGCCVLYKKSKHSKSNEML